MIVWPLSRRGAHADSSTTLESALQRLGPQWTFFTDVAIDTPRDRVILPCVLVCASCGVALLEPAQESRPAQADNASEALFRRFLEAGEFATFYPGYLPIVSLPADRVDCTAPLLTLSDAFAILPPLTIKDEGWADALITVIQSAKSNDDADPRESAEDDDCALSPVIGMAGLSSSVSAATADGVQSVTEDRVIGADADNSISQPIRLRVEPAFRLERVEPTRGVLFWLLGLLGIVGVLAAAIGFSRSESPAHGNIAGNASPAVAPLQDEPSASVAPAPPIPKIETPEPPNERQSTTSDNPLPPNMAARKRTWDGHTHYPAASAPLMLPGDGPPIDATDLPRLEPEVGQNGNGKNGN